MTDKTYPYARQYITDDDIHAVTKVLKSDFLTTGPNINACEKSLQNYIGCSETVVCSNGSAALHLMAMAYTIYKGNFKDNEVVIAPAITFNATAAAFRLVGAKIVFYDSDANHGLLTIESLKDAIALCHKNNLKPRSLICVHLNGQLCDMVAINALCQEHHIAIFEDTCHTLGSIDHNHHKAGQCTYSLASIFSFHGSKNITSGEGGAVTTNDHDMARLMRQLRHHGVEYDSNLYHNQQWAHYRWYHEFQYLALNYRLSDIQCALVISQLQHLDHWRYQRNIIITKYHQHLENIPLLRFISYPDDNIAWHLMVVAIDFQILQKTRHEFMEYLAKNNIFTQVHYIPLYYHPIWKDSILPEQKFTKSELYYQSCLSLPLYIGLDDADIAFICDRIKEFISR